MNLTEEQAREMEARMRANGAPTCAKMLHAEVTKDQRSKFGVDNSNAGKAERTADGILFASERECFHYKALKIAEQAGVISNLELQPRFVLQDGCERDGKKIRPIEYVADFSFIENSRKRIVDVKGVATPVFKLKMKMFRFRYQYLEVEIWK